ncbi:hypothetical protein PCK2_000457 [Pneumocystis canis]|nr:hypothetical protein PCK2_000457 [Pneumocystis canis]
MTFIKIKDFQAYGRRVQSWKSCQTGCQVIYVDIDGPLVKGQFVLATEILNDSGCPHTLEHLIFLGSRRYPYKGFLDSLANRSFAQGTNAWTDTDHTAYTLSTAGEEGFLQMLPVFIDHILFPTLTYDGFYTEVYHVDQEGQDAGVVYCEMQEHEHTMAGLQSIHFHRALFPEGIGYRSHTGGTLTALRVLTVETIRQYHSEYYLPQNLCLIITGKVDTSKLFSILDHIVEPNILQNLTPDLTHWKRPWVDSPQTPLLTQSFKETVLFPDEDESSGEVLLGWLGPSCNDFKTLIALNILGKYLTDSAISVFQKRLGSKTSQIVPTEKLEIIEEYAMELLKEVRDSPADFNLHRIHMILSREQLMILHENEIDPHNIFSNAIITDFLYGDNMKNTLEQSLQDYEYYENLKSWTTKEWLQLLNRWLIENFHVCIISKASTELSSKLQEEEKLRIENRKKELGKEKLELLGKQLIRSREKNDTPFPLTYPLEQE